MALSCLFSKAKRAWMTVLQSNAALVLRNNRSVEEVWVRSKKVESGRLTKIFTKRSNGRTVRRSRAGTALGADDIFLCMSCLFALRRAIVGRMMVRARSWTQSVVPRSYLHVRSTEWSLIFCGPMGHEGHLLVSSIGER